jgi:hypothetical protein
MVLLVENSSRLSRSVEEKRRMGIKREREWKNVEIKNKWHKLGF